MAAVDRAEERVPPDGQPEWHAYGVKEAEDDAAHPRRHREDPQIEDIGLKVCDPSEREGRVTEQFGNRGYPEKWHAAAAAHRVLQVKQ